MANSSQDETGLFLSQRYFATHNSRDLMDNTARIRINTASSDHNTANFNII